MGPRIIVTGGRDLTDYGLVNGALDFVRGHFGDFVLVHGNASGADRLAAQWALARGLAGLPYPADWNKLGRRAGPARNQQMIDDGAILLVRFPGGRGTEDCTARAKAAGIPVMTASRVDGRVFVQGDPDDAPPVHE